MANTTTGISTDASNLPSYNLCEVYCEGVGKIVCEGFKFSKKLKAEAKKDCSSYTGYGWDISDFEYDWEITEPYDYEWFDVRFDAQVRDTHGLTISGYAQNEDGDWIKKDVFKSCIITDTGREYGGGIKRTVKGSALTCIRSDSSTTIDETTTSISTS